MKFSLEEMIERATEPMYLEVAGHEIDRVRQKITHIVNAVRESNDGPERIYFATYSREFELLLSTDKTSAHGCLNDSLNRRTLDEMRKTGAGFMEIIDTIGFQMVKDQDRYQGLADLLGYTFLRYYRDEKQLDIPDDFRGRTLVMLTVSYQQIDKSRKGLFMAVWRKSK